MAAGPIYPPTWLGRFDEKDEHDDPTVDPRSPFAHDRDRVIYSSAFRRLAGKSQVVAAGERGDYHTRLTHTLKVAQLGRRVAEQLRRAAHAPGAVAAALASEDIDLVLAPDPDLIEAACLAHDLGHPPFGHVGEQALNREIDRLLNAKHPEKSWTATKRQAVGGFEGNAQTFRIITYLSVRRGKGGRTGLNLSRATVAATVKYPRLRQHASDPDDEYAKWGAYGVDAERLKWAMGDQAPGPSARPTFEAQVMDWCDDVTYAVHDVIDFYRAGLIPLDKLLRIERGIPDDAPLSKLFGADALTFLEQYAYEHEENSADVLAAWRMIANCSRIAQAWEPTFSVKAGVQTTTGNLITTFVKDVGWTTWGEGESDDYRYGDGLPMLYEGDFVIDRDPAVAKQKRLAVDILKALIWKKVIQQPRLATQQVGQDAIVTGLLQRIAGHEQAAHEREAEDEHVQETHVLPVDRLEEFRDHGDAIRAASDHVASLAEADAEVLYRRLTGIRLGAFSDVF
jgi:dGTPase